MEPLRALIFGAGHGTVQAEAALAAALTAMVARSVGGSGYQDSVGRDHALSKTDGAGGSGAATMAFDGILSYDSTAKPRGTCHPDVRC